MARDDAASNLATYLNDHLAGSTAAIELAEKTRSKSEGTPLATFLSDLLRDIRADQAVLRDVMARLQADTQSLKQTIAWAGEKASRLKFQELVGGSPDLNRLLELESLGIGVEGKRGLWSALKRIAPSEPRLAGVDFDPLIERAEQQLDRIERQRLEQAERALAA